MDSKLRTQTVLQQMLEEINFQRTKEMRQMLKDDSGFVVLQGTTYWTDLFVRHFIYQSETDANDTEADDILFFVRKKHVKGTSRNMPKYDTEVDVFRKDSRKLPIGDPDVDWEETVYLNLIIHQFNYTLTLAICTRTSPKELQVLRRHSQRVYASPSRRKMDTKGDGEEMTFPHICFMVDNFDEVFSDIMVRDGEMVCVELVASDRDGTVQGVIFLGSIRYDALKKVYDSRQSSLSSKVAQRMTFGLFSAAGPQTRCEFVRMKGPQGKGHAEMAVTKPKGSGVETPTSEPGFCATDMWDEWEEDSENYYTNRHQRRLSDPSANLNNFSRHGWKSKTGAGGGEDEGASVGTSASNRFAGKARSQNEGLDTLASELSEVEAGDLRDDRPASSVPHKSTAAASCAAAASAIAPQMTPLPSASSASATQHKSVQSPSPSTTGAASSKCCPGCFGTPSRRRRGAAAGSNSHRWSSDSSYGCQMSEIYCRDCTETTQEPRADGDMPAGENFLRTVRAAEVDVNSPACLATVPLGPQRGILLRKPATTLLNVKSELEMLGSSQAKNALINSNQQAPANGSTSGEAITPKSSRTDRENNPTATASVTDLELEIGDDVSAGMGVDDGTDGNDVQPVVADVVDGVAIVDSGLGTRRVHGTEEVPAPQVNICAVDAATNRKSTSIANSTELRQRQPTAKGKNCVNAGAEDTDNGNHQSRGRRDSSSGGFATLPKIKRANSVATSNPVNGGYRRKVPMRTTPDGTNIYYWCDLSRRAQKELDDGAYNPLWTSRGFTQTFHFWKEHRRQQSTPLNAFLTYVTLPWWSIAKDLLDHRETPILTF